MLTGLALITAWLGAVFIVASLISKRWPQQQELSRKVVHIGAGFALPIAWATEIPASIALAAAALASALALINHRWRLLASIEDVRRFSYGTVAYGVSITLLLAFTYSTKSSPHFLLPHIELNILQLICLKSWTTEGCLG